MPRIARKARGGVCYHVINRGNERQPVFHDDNEYASFLQLLHRACQHQPMRVLAFCLMPNHFHLCLWPHEDGDLGRYMQWLTTTHVAQFRKSHAGVGHVWQGRYKAFPTESDSHLLRVLRYIERNPVRAGLVERAQEWPWSSAGLATEFLGRQGTVLMHGWPVPKPADWLAWLNKPEEQVELDRIRRCVKGGTPFGNPDWARQFAG